MTEVKFGFIPGVDQSAHRIRRRFRMQKGGHPQLVLVHYSSGQHNGTSPYYTRRLTVLEPPPPLPRQPSSPRSINPHATTLFVP